MLERAAVEVEHGLPPFLLPTPHILGGTSRQVLALFRDSCATTQQVQRTITKQFAPVELTH
jgi:hypothetical protein